MRAFITLRGSVTIASGDTISSAFDLQGCRLFGLVIPGEFDGTAVTFQVSPDGTNYQALYNEGTQYSITTAASRNVAVNPTPFKGWNYIKVVAGTAQTGATAIGIVADVADA